jgi:hypothetical protein
MPAPIGTDWHRLPGGFSVRFAFDLQNGALEADWRPRAPASRREFKRLAPAYRRVRDAFLRELVPGQKVLVIE